LDFRGQFVDGLRRLAVDDEARLSVEHHGLGERLVNRSFFENLGLVGRIRRRRPNGGLTRSGILPCISRSRRARNGIHRRSGQRS
jgi:hypothetical protein